MSVQSSSILSMVAHHVVSYIRFPALIISYMQFSIVIEPDVLMI